jgi:hypothetical protein
MLHHRERSPRLNNMPAEVLEHVLSHLKNANKAALAMTRKARIYQPGAKPSEFNRALHHLKLKPEVRIALSHRKAFAVAKDALKKLDKHYNTYVNKPYIPGKSHVYIQGLHEKNEANFMKHIKPGYFVHSVGPLRHREVKLGTNLKSMFPNIQEITHFSPNRIEYTTKKAWMGRYDIPTGYRSENIGRNGNVYTKAFVRRHTVHRTHKRARATSADGG